MMRMIPINKCYLPVTGLLAAFVLGAIAHAAAAEERPIKGGMEWAQALVDSQFRQFKGLSAEERIPFSRWTDTDNFEKFMAGEEGCQVLYHGVWPGDSSAAVLKEQWPDGGPQPGAFIIGQARVAVIVHAGNPIPSLTTGQLAELLRISGEGKSWREILAPATDEEEIGEDGNLGEAQRGAARATTGARAFVDGVVRPYAEDPETLGSRVVRRACMMLGPEFPTGYYFFREDFNEAHTAEQIMEKVGRDRHAIGFFLYNGQELPAGVRLLPVSTGGEAGPVVMDRRPVIQPGYPLSLPLVLYLRPDASDEMREFCRFAVGPEGAEIARSHGLITMRDHLEYQAEQRVAGVRSAQGAEVRALVPDAALRALVPQLGMEYVRAKETMLLQTGVAESETAAVASFLGSGDNRPDLLFLSSQPSEAVMREHGGAWRRMMPEEHLLAGRAVAVIVNGVNEVDALSVEQLQDIFLGRMNDWSAVVPNSGNATAGNPIQRFGLPRNDPAALVMHRERVVPPDVAHIETKEDTAAVVAAVSLNEGGIGIVDLALLPTTGQTVKVLGVMVGDVADETDGRVLHATAETIASGGYPFTERVYLYVNPKGNPVAQGFAKFLAEGSPDKAVALYTDSVEKVAEVYHKNGLMRIATMQKAEE